MFTIKKYICMSFHSLIFLHSLPKKLWTRNYFRNGTIFTFDLRCAIVSGRRERRFWQCYQDFAVFHNPSNFRPLITQQNRVWCIDIDCFHLIKVERDTAIMVQVHWIRSKDCRVVRFLCWPYITARVLPLSMSDRETYVYL